ncbi:MAG: tRNA pseudouridine synthase B [Paracidovorax wautersii]|uniref:tRNA pseudouridine synthase B n=1 Tax=Paracidovorax wautersii TaxID=1177982 RepID=A0A7V8FLZ1_9BURK|nr:MAG: tRNA pseudouridine synthase B [Paracidovorax wautersii]
MTSSRASNRVRIVRRPVHGVLLLDKPLGLSSNDALQKVKWLLRAEKAGHTGTLDPLATGALPLCFGAATKFSQLHLDADKTYEAVARLGVTTTTGDAEGEVLAQTPVPAITPEQLEAVRQRFLGPIQQVPPMYSALKKDGKALYEYARAGIEVERPARDVVIHALALALDADAEGHAQLRIRACCSKGTYIRTLGEDLGAALGCGAHLSFLRRVRTGDFDVAQAVTLAELEAMDEAQRLHRLMPVEELLRQHQAVTLQPQDAGRFLSGMRRRVALPETPFVQVWGESPRALLGTGHIRGGELIPTRLLSPVEVGQIQLQQAGGGAVWGKNPDNTDPDAGRHAPQPSTGTGPSPGSPGPE